MRDFDRVELGSVRTLGEAEHWFKAHQGAAGRLEFRASFGERVRGFANRILMRKGEGEFA